MAIELRDLLKDLEDLARRTPLVDRRADLGRLLRFDANLSEPIHRWFKFKESFSSSLVRQLLKEHRPHDRHRIAFLDPFCGVGTSLLAAEDVLDELGFKHIVLRGVEVNPYLAFVARTKLDWARYDPAVMLRGGAVAMNGLQLGRRPPIPALSTIRNARYADRKHVRRLIEIREKINDAMKGRPERKPLLLGLAAASERVFHLRKDGRALRFSPRPGSINVDQELMVSWSCIAEDLQLGRKKGRIDYSIKSGDGRRADRLFHSERFDVILFSPPYLNNIDYTEVYKIELWLLGFLNSSHDMVAQRRRTFRSHPSCLFPRYRDAEVDEVLSILGDPFRRLLDYADAQQNGRRRVFGEYFADVLRTLRGCRRLLTRRGRALMVVGNSLHGNGAYPIPVATDLWVAALASAARLRVDAVMVGRDLARRRIGPGLLRESVVVMSKS